VIRAACSLHKPSASAVADGAQVVVNDHLNERFARTASLLSVAETLMGIQITGLANPWWIVADAKFMEGSLGALRAAQHSTLHHNRACILHHTRATPCLALPPPLLLSLIAMLSTWQAIRRWWGYFLSFVFLSTFCSTRLPWRRQPSS
jgi:hypothetical protein